jgi:hypothetical protein
MFELDSAHFGDVLPLYRELGLDFPLICEVIVRRQRGQIFVDRRDVPRSALVVTGFGFACALGSHEGGEVSAVADLLSTPGALKPSYLLWYAPPSVWQRTLDRIGPPAVRRRDRVRFTPPRDRADFLAEPTRVPAGCTLGLLTADLIPQTSALGIDLGSRFWSSINDFVTHSFGTCLLDGEEMASLCYAAGIADGFAEMDLITHPAFRGRGMGGAVARQFMKESLSRNLVPRWDTFASNAGSMTLARRFELATARTYPLYSFNVPLTFPSGDDVEEAMR